MKTKVAKVGPKILFTGFDLNFHKFFLNILSNRNFFFRKPIHENEIGKQKISLCVKTFQGKIKNKET